MNISRNLTFSNFNTETRMKQYVGTEYICGFRVTKDRMIARGDDSCHGIFAWKN